jgi:hypothetical protein
VGVYFCGGFVFIAVDVSLIGDYEKLIILAIISCSAFKLYVKKKSKSCGVGVPPALNIQFKCATAYSNPK